MKPGWLLFTIITIIILGGLGCLFFKTSQPGAFGSCPAEENFAAFRAERLLLPVRGEPVCLVAVGDIMLSRGVAGEIKGNGGDPAFPFSKVKNYLKSGDIVFGNLENPITPGREIMIREMTLRADPGVETALHEAGFTILSLANNHVPDFGKRGLLDTFQCLERAGIEYVGAGKTENEAFAARYIEIKELKLAFLGFCDPVLLPGTDPAGTDHPAIACLEREKIQAAVREAREKADFVVVSMHAGTEYESSPELAQTRFARLAVDAGADLVLGHHPHVLQGIEEYKGKYIFYSLGNFVFDQKWSLATRQGLLAKIFIGAAGVEKIECLPVLINDRDQPQPLEGEAAEPVLKALGLDLRAVPVPAWDQESQVFKESKSYIFYVQKLLAFRLEKERYFDLDQDGVPEIYSLRDGILKVMDGPRLIWRSRDDWWVDDFFLGDADNDGIPELSLLVWKSGSFGPYKPFWITEEDYSVKNHLFIFKLVEGAIKPVWQSSNLDRPNYEADLADLDGDGTNELVVVEGDYDDPRVRETRVWKWNGWGFSMVE